MENEDFKRIGEDLFGHGWQTRMAKALGMDGSTIRRWVGAAVPVPPQIASYLEVLGSRQEARGALVYALQRLTEPLAVVAGSPTRLEWMRKRLQFPGVDSLKPMPAINASMTGDAIALAFSGDQADATETDQVSYTLTRHPDSRHLAGYVEAAVAEGHAPAVTSHRFHHYSVIAHHPRAEPVTMHQISTHSGTLRTIEAPVGTDGMTGMCSLRTLPGGDALGED